MLTDPTIDIGQPKMIDLIMKYDAIWDLGEKPNVTHTPHATCGIDTGDHSPIRSAYRKTDEVEDRIIWKHVQEMARRGVIRPSKSPWASPVLLADKKNGKIRFWIDYRRLNKVTKQDAYPLPKMEAVMSVLGGAKHFSTIDLTDAFWSIRVAEEDIEKTAFICKHGLWEFISMPFGLTNAPATQQRFIEAVLNGLIWKCCFAYIDDILVYSKDFETHLEDLEEILQRLQENRLKIQPEKCSFCKPTFEILGYVATPNGLQPSERKIKALKEYPYPRSVKETQSFLGIVSWLRRFIPGCSKLTKELRECAKANPKKFNLSEAARKEVDMIKEIITADTCLAHPNENEQYFIHVDASKDGIGAILTQLDENKKHRVIEYASRVLTPAQSRYSNTIREALGVIWSLDHFRHYVIDRNPIVFTDCDCLTHLAKDDATGIPKVAALRSWLARMLHYQPKLVHKPGKLMAIPDALSRHYVEYLIYDKDSERIEDSAEILGSMIRTAWESRYIPNQGLRMQDDLLKKLPTTEVDEFKDTREIRVLAMSTHQQQAVNEFKKNLMWEDDDDEDDDHHRESDKEDEAEIILPSDIMIANEQRHDLQLAPLIEYLVDRTLPKSRSQRAHIKRIAHQYYLDGKGTLHKIVLRDKTEQNIGDPVVLPRQLWDQTISAYHDNPLGGGHRKRTKLIKSLRQNYTFEGMDLYVATYCQTCSQCQTSMIRKRNTAPLKPIIANYPGVLIQLDCTSGGQPTEMGNKGILTIIESFSGHIRLYPIPDQTAQTIAERLTSYIAIHSMPLKIITDNGTEFRNQLMTEMSHLLGFRHDRITPYNSKSNSKVENAHKTVQTMVRAYIKKYKKTWDKLLPLLEFAYNTSTSVSTGYTPFYLHFGRHPIMPIDSYFNIVQRPSMTSTEYAKHIEENMKSVVDHVVEFKKEQAKQMADKYNKKHKQTMSTLRTGDLVRMRNEKRVGENNMKYNDIYSDEIFVVIENAGDAVYHIQDLNRFQPHKTVNIRSLIKIHKRNKMYFDTDKQIVSAANVEYFIDQEDKMNFKKKDESVNSDSDNEMSVGKRQTVQEFLIENILDERIHKGKKQVLVKWKGFRNENNTWEPEKGINDSSELIEAMRRRKADQEKKNKNKNKKKSSNQDMDTSC